MRNDSVNQPIIDIENEEAGEESLEDLPVKVLSALSPPWWGNGNSLPSDESV